MTQRSSSSEDSPEEAFAEQLEERARHFLQGRQAKPRGPWSPSSSLDEEITLVLHRLDATRHRFRTAAEGLLCEECYVGTELRQMEQRTPRYSSYRFPEREKLQRALGRLAQERRRLELTEGEKVDVLHERLLSLLGKRRLLSVD